MCCARCFACVCAEKDDGCWKRGIEEKKETTRGGYAELRHPLKRITTVIKRRGGKWWERKRMKMRLTAENKMIPAPVLLLLLLGLAAGENTGADVALPNSLPSLGQEVGGSEAPAASSGATLTFVSRMRNYRHGNWF